MVENSYEMGKLLQKNLLGINIPLVKEIRGRGLFIGLEFKSELKKNGNDFSKILMKNGILSKATKDSTIRFSPALIINKSEIYEATEIIKYSLE